MNIILKVANWLDRKEFLRFRLWEFSFGNASRFFLWYFYFRVLIPHPIKALKGFFEYRQLVRDANGESLTGSADLAEIHQYILNDKRNPQKFIIAPGFCLKPYDVTGQKSKCPVGRFNHDCLVLEKSELLFKDRQYWLGPCRECDIGKLAQLGAKLHADLYIMTSALDIARDLFLPAIKGEETRSGVFLLCKYSTEAFTLGLTTCGIAGALITFCSGDCVNHKDFTRADKGFKETQTQIETSLLDHLSNELLKLADLLPKSAEVYLKMGNIYKIGESYV